MALHEFMPYGAPELLADQDRRMARASAVATAALVAVFVALAIAIPRMPHAADAPAETPTVYVIEAPPALERPAAAPTVTPAAPVTSPLEHAVPEPVPDAIAPEPVTSQPPATGGDGTAEPGDAPATGGEPGDGGIAPATDPDPVWGAPAMVDVFPALVSSPDVLYPDLAREAGIEGRVVVRMLVGRDGRVKDAVVDPKFSVPMLDAAALAAARASVFTPATTNGHAVAVWVARPYEFRLH
ncbi:MAG: TonB family protein [Candidatus Eisenbacteria bacterium]